MNSETSSVIKIEFNDNSLLSSLFGTSDRNIHLLEKLNNVSIEYKGNIVKIVGKENAVKDDLIIQLIKENQKLKTENKIFKKKLN